MWNLSIGINCDFRQGNLINQRTLDSYIGNLQPQGVCTSDMWRLFPAEEAIIPQVDLLTNGIKLYKGSILIQFAELAIMQGLLGKTLTMSVEYENGVISQGTATLPSVMPSVFTTYAFIRDGNLSVDVALGTAQGQYQLFRIYSNRITEISRVKLELGTISTLANEPHPNPQEELAKCQRYAIELNTGSGDIGIGICCQAGHIRCFVPLPVTLRKGVVPTVVQKGSISGMHNYSSPNIDLVFNTTYNVRSNNGILMDFTTTEAVTLGASYAIRLEYSTSLFISAEL